MASGTSISTITAKSRGSRTRREATGTLEYNAGVRYAAGTRSDVPAHTANLTANGATTTTSATGTFTFTGANPATVAPTCTGTEVMVVNQAGAAATTTLSVPNGGARDLERRERRIRRRAGLDLRLRHDRDRAREASSIPAIAAWLDPFVFYVNETTRVTRTRIPTACTSRKSVARCENTGRVADVVFHEFGHSRTITRSSPAWASYELALAEGLADFNAANITEDSGIGRGFDFTDAPLREIDPVGYERVYPADVNVDRARHRRDHQRRAVGPAQGADRRARSRSRRRGDREDLRRRDAARRRIFRRATWPR